jgi:hypothetical protein
VPWKPSQRKAIAADLGRRGKSDEEISRFFHEHGHGGYGKKKKLKRKKKS